jgi:hypothetical protein
VNQTRRSPEYTGRKGVNQLTAVEDIVETELERVERWRTEELMRAGYDPAGAVELGARLDIDLHTATDLLERGCPVELALQILL